MSTEPPSGSGPRQPPPGGGPYDGGSSGDGPHGGGPPGSGPPPGGPPPGGPPPEGPGSGPPGGWPGGGPPPGGGAPGGGPYGPPPGGGPPGGGPYGGGPYGGGPPGGPYPPDPLAGMPPLADSAKRTAARIIDMIMVGVVVWLLTLGFRVNDYTMNADRFQFGASVAQAVVGAVLYIAYDTFMISRSGQTLGKKWLGMRVANLADGSTPSVSTALGRAAVLWLPFYFCCPCLWLALAGGWSYFDRPYKQGLHDKAARTVVVSVE